MRRSSIGDSFELMLDTICNSFGGIVLITILLAVLTRDGITSREVELRKLRENLEVVAYREKLMHELQGLEEDIEELQKSQGDLPDEFVARVDEYCQLEQRSREIRSRIDDLLQRERNLMISEQELEKALKDLRTEIRNKERELETKAAELASAKARSSFSIVLPRERLRLESGPGLILRYDRMYVWHIYDSRGEPIGLNVADFFIVTEEHDGIYVKPRPERGIPIVPENAGAIVKRLRECRAGTTLDIGLWPDTFDSWPIFRKAVVEGGFQYRLLLMREDGKLVDRGGTDSHIQ